MRIKLLLLLSALSGVVLAAEHQVTIVGSSFTPAEIDIEVGDTVTWTNMSGIDHNVRADDDSFRCATSCSSSGGNPSPANWSASVTFSVAGDVPYYCEAHGGPGGLGMSGVVRVTGEPEPPPFPVNEGLNGAWYDPAASGQGFNVEIVPALDPPLLTIAWYTYATTPGGPESQRWFTAYGNVSSESNSVPLDIYRTTGSVFTVADPPAVNTQVGTGTVHFDSCTSGSFDYEVDFSVEGEEPDVHTGSIAIQRLTPDLYCDAIVNTPVE